MEYPTNMDHKDGLVHLASICICIFVFLRLRNCTTAAFFPQFLICPFYLTTHQVYKAGIFLRGVFVCVDVLCLSTWKNCT